jgi:hypothetical protein
MHLGRAAKLCENFVARAFIRAEISCFLPGSHGHHHRQQQQQQHHHQQQHNNQQQQQQALIASKLIMGR